MEENISNISPSRKILRKSLSLKEKMDIIFQLENEANPSICALSKRIKVARATISRIWKDRMKIRNNFQHKDSKVRRCRPLEFQKIDEALLQWYTTQKNHSPKISIGGSTLLKKASEFAEIFNIPNFRSSNGWLYKWKKRNNIGACTDLKPETINEVHLTETMTPSFKEMCSTGPGWNRCFICSAVISETYFTRNDKPACKILFKYLLQSNQIVKSEENLYEDVLRCIFEDGGNTRLFKDSEAKLCSFCDRQSNKVKELHLQLEVLQMNIIDKLNAMKQAVIINSSIYGSNGCVKLAMGNFEKWALDQEAIGWNCENERWYFEILQRFQSFVFENDTQLKRIPLVYLKKYTGATDSVTGHQHVKQQETSLNIQHDISNDWEVQMEQDYGTSGADLSSLSSNNSSDHDDRKECLPQPTSRKRKIRYQRQRSETNASQPVTKKSNLNSSKGISCISPSQTEKKLTEAQKLAIEIKKVLNAKPYSGRSRKGKRKTFICTECPFQAKKASTMEQHLREHETPEITYECPDCHKRFSQQQFYEFHMIQYCGSTLWKCEVCNKPIHGGKQKEHFETHHEGRKVYSCEYCDNCFGSFPALVTHSQYHPGWSLKCDYCPDNSKFYDRRFDLRRHLCEVHNHTELLLKCSYKDCKREFFDEATLSSHMNVHLKRFVCKVCTKPFPQRNQLEVHVRTQHNKEKPFECDHDHCSEKFALKDSLQRHKMRMHNFSKFTCYLCQKEFADRIGMEWHMQSSHGVGDRKTFDCEICRMQFFRKSILQKHLGTHLDRKEFTCICDVCGFTTRTNSLLKLHMVKHDGVKKFACTYCPKAFTLAKYLRDHLRTHTKIKPFQCEICGSSFNQGGALNLHRKRHTKEDDGGA